MKIRRTKLAAGPKGVQKAGTVITVSKREGEALIAAKAGEEVAEEKAPAKKEAKKDKADSDGDDGGPPKREAGVETAAAEDDERAASRTDRKPARWTRGGTI